MACRRSASLCALLVAACGGPQSALAPAGRGAERIALIFWWMAGGAAVVWLAVLALGVYCLRARPGHNEARIKVMILGGGALVPTVALAVLLVFGLAEMPDLLAQAPEGSLRIAVSGEQWWWRVRYLPPAGEPGGPVELANEIRLPVGEPVQLVLDSPDVIHSFWVPSLAGKMDMIPGRVTFLALEPTRTGVFLGACAEYCGSSHALMSFHVKVQERAEFERWLAHQRRPARPPPGALGVRGRELFLANGCGACHTVRGTPADGVVGPDLTHVGSRLALAGGVLPNDPGGFRRWISHPDHVKPDALMPAFGMLPPEDVRALTAYLEDLE